MKTRNLNTRTLLDGDVTVGAALSSAIEQLAPVGATPRLDAELLLMAVCGLDRAQLITHTDTILTNEQTQRLCAFVARRQNGEPIAYLMGTREFWSMELSVSASVLIPRPDTEVLVERTLACIPSDAQWTVADIGTGCGAIALALAKERPRCRVIATDNSLDALRMARQNAARLGLRAIEFRHGHWLAPVAGETLHVLVSNPPYVGNDDPCLTTGEARFEPIRALAGGADGLYAIRDLVAHARACLQPGGWLVLEHGSDQARAVRELMRRAGYDNVAGYADLAGLDRVSRAHNP
ncbi:MAG: peptide chain release factor N(5)-glutamine methyltransferase [Acidiferrobacterales bacterium]